MRAVVAALTLNPVLAALTVNPVLAALTLNPALAALTLNPVLAALTLHPVLAALTLNRKPCPVLYLLLADAPGVVSAPDQGKSCVGHVKAAAQGAVCKAHSQLRPGPDLCGLEWMGAWTALALSGAWYGEGSLNTIILCT